MKRLVCLLLCISLLTVPVSAETERGSIQQTMMDHYVQILRNTNMASLAGWCGLMASWQLYLLGINQMVDSYHGCNQFDAYREVAITSGGHRVQALDARDYGLEAALNHLTQDGKQNVYNILVGFETTNTYLGAIYGHSMVIYGILEGTVYFLESYATPFGPAGRPLTASIADFAAYYEGRGQYEGCIHFGKKGYAANCQRYATNAYLTVTEDTQLWQEPRQGTALRDVGRGERLWATALYQNPEGDCFYQVETGYVPAVSAELFAFQYSDVSLVEERSPEKLAVGEDFPIGGRVSADFSSLGSLHLTVTDGEGIVQLDHAMAKQSGVYDLQNDIFSALVDFSRLPEGSYCYRLTAMGENAWFDGVKICRDRQTLPVAERFFQVGDPQTALVSPETVPVPLDGWVLEEGLWYYFEKGEPRPGWFCYRGGDYYFQADGAVTTGWAVINGKRRYFSQTGSMRTGWLDTEEGRMYLLFNGEPAVGERTVDGAVYCFDERGYLKP